MPLHAIKINKLLLLFLNIMQSRFVLTCVLATSLLLCVSSDRAIVMPMTTVGGGASTIHLVPVALGTPPQTLRLLADTGSDATWVFCDRAADDDDNGTSSSDRHRKFYHSRSSTFKFLHCAEPPSDTCRYKREYCDGSSTGGVWAAETMTVESTDGSDVTVDNVVIGCSDRRSTNFSDADGVLALSAGYPSLTSQLADKFGRKFSFGLAGDDRLAFGETKRADFRREDMQYVRLARGDPSAFFVGVSSVSVNDVQLDIPKKAWGGGVILDTGTTATYVVEAAYRAILAYFVEFFRDSDDVKLSDSNICFAPYGVEFVGMRPPRVSIEFEGGARLEPTEEEVYYRDADGMSCLAIWPVGRGEVPVVGSAVQKGYFWEYDLENQRVGFAPLVQNL